MFFNKSGNLEYNEGLHADDLYTIVVIKSYEFSKILASLNKKGYLNESDIKPTQIYRSYYYSSEFSMLNMRHSKNKWKHNLTEHYVFIATNETIRNGFFQVLAGWVLDYDSIMINQIQ